MDWFILPFCKPETVPIGTVFGHIRQPCGNDGVQRSTVRRRWIGLFCHSANLPIAIHCIDFFQYRRNPVSRGLLKA
jgi:hypothetical protein